MLCECSLYCLGRPTNIYHPSGVLGPSLELFPYQESLFWRSVLTGKCTLRRGERYVSCQVPGGASGAHTDWRDLPYYILTATAILSVLALYSSLQYHCHHTAYTFPTLDISSLMTSTRTLSDLACSVGGEKII